MCLQVGLSSGQVVLHFVSHDATRTPSGHFPSPREVPVATVGTAIPPCHSPVASLTAKCLHACDVDDGGMHGDHASGSGHAQLSVADVGGARVLAVCYFLVAKEELIHVQALLGAFIVFMDTESARQRSPDRLHFLCLIPEN